MPISYLRRPLFLLLVAYLGLLCLLRARGVIQKPPWEYHPPGYYEEGALGGLRRAVLSSYSETLDPDHAAVLGGVVMGERSSLPRDLVRAFRRAGAMHLLVASGSNVAFALLLAAGSARLLGASRAQSFVAGALGALLYTLCAGADPPLVRGFLMTVAALAGYFFGRNPGAFQGLVLSCWALALWDPRVVFNAGFQMSFAACFGLVASSKAWRPPPRWPAPARFVVSVFFASLAAQIAITPVIAAHFRQVSLAALFSNVLLVPMSGVLMYAGFALTGVHWVAPALDRPVGSLVDLALACFEWLVRFFAAWGLYWRTPPPGPVFLAVYYAVVVCLWCRRDKKEYNTSE